jgi:hypothetical protein
MSTHQLLHSLPRSGYLIANGDSLRWGLAGLVGELGEFYDDGDDSSVDNAEADARKNNPAHNKFTQLSERIQHNKESVQSMWEDDADGAVLYEYSPATMASVYIQQKSQPPPLAASLPTSDGSSIATAIAAAAARSSYGF